MGLIGLFFLQAIEGVNQAGGAQMAKQPVPIIPQAEAQAKAREAVGASDDQSIKILDYLEAQTDEELICAFLSSNHKTHKVGSLTV